VPVRLSSQNQLDSKKQKSDSRIKFI